MASPSPSEEQRQLQEHEHSKDLITILDPSSVAAEAYRTMRTNLLYGFVDHPPKVIVISSPNLGEGKTTTCANLGIVLAQADHRTLLLDCDLRRPALHRHFGFRNLRGVADVVVGAADIHDVWQEPLPKLKVVTAGFILPNPTELLSSIRFARFLNMVRQEFDYVLVDTPPAGPVSDPAILGAQADGVLLVLDVQNTSKGALRESKRNLDAVGATVLGTIVNNVDASSRGYYRNRAYTY
jgi:capsular exopolysaccharide synthesis family protein